MPDCSVFFSIKKKKNMQNEPWYSTGWAFTPQKFTVRTTAQSHSHSSTYYTVYTESGRYTAASYGIGLKRMWNLSKEHLIQSKPLKRGWCFCKVKAAVVHRGTVRVITHSKNHICQPVSLYTRKFGVFHVRWTGFEPATLISSPRLWPPGHRHSSSQQFQGPVFFQHLRLF